MRWMIQDLDQTQEIVLREVISHSGVLGLMALLVAVNLSWPLIFATG
jgi:hypothetical protein